MVEVVFDKSSFWVVTPAPGERIWTLMREVFGAATVAGGLVVIVAYVVRQIASTI